jgi:hypothetical protein
MQTHHAQQPRDNRSKKEKEKGMQKTLVVVTCLVLSLVATQSSADHVGNGGRFPPPPNAVPDVAGANITGITLSPMGGYGIKITVDPNPRAAQCPEGYVLRSPNHNDIYHKEAFSTLLAAW